MNVVLWILQVVLALTFAFAGFGKLTRPRDKLIQQGMGFVEDFPQPVIRMVGTLELLGAVGLVIPAWTGIAPVLTPIAATGLMGLMVGAVITHTRRGEFKIIPVNVALFLLAAVVAWGRFGPYAY